MKCPQCSGPGIISRGICPLCRGAGYLSKNECAALACAAILVLPQQSPGKTDPYDMACGMARAIAHAEGYNTALAQVRSILAQHGITKDS
jgi:hypothetical protein